MRDTNLGDEPKPVTEYLSEFSVTEPFETDLDRVNVQSLGMSIHSLEHGRGTYDYELLEGMEGGAALYDPPPDFSSVLMFETGWGYYCCQSPQDLEEVRGWFEENFSEYAEAEITPIQSSNW
ncbi:MAG: hypothetical protein ABEJ36_04105 [Candidatus Nanosalina sp.]